jgi:hypothetical protein
LQIRPLKSTEVFSFEATLLPALTKSEKVRENQRKLEKTREGERKAEKVRENQRR